MNKSKEIVEGYYIAFSENYKRKTIGIALEIIESVADTYKESYMPPSVFDGEFTPHNWVVAAICESLESKKFWKGCYKRGNI